MAEQPPVPLFAPGSSTDDQNVPGMSTATAAAVAQRGTPATLNLDDIFGDCFFTPEGETVFSNEVQEGVLPSGEGQNVANVASKLDTNTQSYQAVQAAGGIQTTNLDKPGQRATVMGGPAPAAGTAPKQPFQQPPQRQHHMQFATPASASALKKRSRNTTSGRSSSERKMSEQQKVERRERNREHAKRSRIRKKFLLESLQQSVALLKEENDKLRDSIRSHLGDDEAEDLLKQGLSEQAAGGGLIASSAGDANKVLDDPDFSFIKALQTAQQNFVVTDPSLPDNPIVYATQGFLNLTGYTLDQVLGRNCRFLQGPETDPKAVEKIRRAIEEGNDMSVCLLNYRVDGSTFWNQFFIAALRDASGNITNYVGVQCKVSDQYAANVCKKQEEEAAAAAAAENEGEDNDDNMESDPTS
jgi:PAS domain S-box-containing protein|mmetsp:Transcript_12391/g.16315  ORF Transcript_12391/g.16315 Transcript_12391/m.16315 type:complete len:414 (+) Transcript_12391:62-1303(+)|eukprot:CAMPEP_0195290668 /NCGR_PEP_ID=MMETSP0707-20130614/6442_1 /TAXON_ID=33640 /ORGANISM="Asterionellopsis glacialis, Strain CCMP134" /LENGTH=413 /DNA_ID=CAMNT_0040350825 /DNA_START=111 /DNA_END=1352 /DNA_ORIENTATION=+